jgi:hypothetical protein
MRGLKKLLVALVILSLVGIAVNGFAEEMEKERMLTKGYVFEIKGEFTLYEKITIKVPTLLVCRCYCSCHTRLITRIIVPNIEYIVVMKPIGKVLLVNVYYVYLGHKDTEVKIVSVLATGSEKELMGFEPGSIGLEGAMFMGKTKEYKAEVSMTTIEKLPKILPKGSDIPNFGGDGSEEVFISEVYIPVEELKSEVTTEMEK